MFRYRATVPHDYRTASARVARVGSPAANACPPALDRRIVTFPVLGVSLLKAWIDVGGTFTDCFVVDDAGERQRLKILSSGITKTSIQQVTADQYRLTDLAGEAEQFWSGFELRRLDRNGQVHERRRVLSFRGSDGVCTLDRPLDSLPRENELIELHSPLAAPVLAVRRVLGLGLQTPLPPLDVRLGTTRGTNALLTRTGADVGLVVTQGFADLLRIGSQERPDLFALQVQKPNPLTEHVIGIRERLAADGAVLTPLDEPGVRDALTRLRERGVDSLAICLLHAYRNDQHERRVAEIAADIGFTEISRSSEVAPLIKLLQRAETTTLDAYLNPILAGYVARVWQQFGGPVRTRLRLMTSGGQLVAADQFRGRDSVLSGPAGGVVALAAIGRSAKKHLNLGAGVIGLDMGGTSTDVSRWEGELQREFEARKAGVRIMTPMMAIHTVAAGGGSICQIQHDRLLVGPASAGADPGPACYGGGGPLTVTDVNLALGRIAVDRFPFPLDHDAVHRRLREARLAFSGSHAFDSPEALAEGFWKIAVNHMAEAVRTVSTAEGSDPRQLSLVSFGGAAGQHACAVASALGMRSVIDHPDASMLSALGMGLAPIGRFAARGVYQTLEHLTPDQLDAWHSELRAEAETRLFEDVGPQAQPRVRGTVELRYLAAEQTLEIPLEPVETLDQRFTDRHREFYGYTRPERAIELVTVRVDVEVLSNVELQIELSERPTLTQPESSQSIFIDGQWQRAARLDREQFAAGERLHGPALICSPGSTLVVPAGWSADMASDGSIVCRDQVTVTPETTPDEPAASRARTPRKQPPHAQTTRASIPITQDQRVMLEIIARRLQGIAEQMGEVLRRTSVSVNVKERLDYSCAVFRHDGSLVAGAMHVPVHLGAMGHTVRSIRNAFPHMHRGDAYVSNNPYAGGSHLPDVTVVNPVFISDDVGRPDFFVASRAHHAEIGGMTPGSMPANAERLGEEGVVIDHFALVRNGVSHEHELEQLLRESRYPSRTPRENMADLAAQLAAGRRGVADLERLSAQLGRESLDAFMETLLQLSADSLTPILERLRGQTHRFQDQLLPGVPLVVALDVRNDRLRVDFTGTSGVHPTGWNATPAIVSAAVLYVLRCLADHPLPLNEGALRRLDLIIPPGLLNPPAAPNPEDSPAVVAGNVETSQRIVDCLIGALGVAAASQGTMNNLLIGNDLFGYYETICGGTGATEHGPGADAVHSHMTNTRITDAEILETRYPLRLREFSVRPDSGGPGLHRGGHGVIRELEALTDLSVTLLTSRREPPPPFGIAGGQAGSCGINTIIRRDSTTEPLPAAATTQLHAGDRLRIETPGGGAWRGLQIAK